MIFIQCYYKISEKYFEINFSKPANLRPTVEYSDGKFGS